MKRKSFSVKVEIVDRIPWEKVKMVRICPTGYDPVPFTRLPSSVFKRLITVHRPKSSDVAHREAQEA